MKKTITIILIITMLSGLFSACSQQNNAHSSPTVTEENIPTTESVAETNASTEPTTHDLTLYDVIDWLNAYADQNNLNHVKDLETESIDETGTISYHFSFLDEQVDVIIEEKDGVAIRITACTFLSSLSNVESKEDAIIIGIGLATLPMVPCEPNFDAKTGLNWHAEQIAEKVKTSGSYAIESKYSRGGWEYSCSTAFNGIALIMSATKQCGDFSSSSSDTLSEVLDFSKVWKVDFTADGTSGTFHYAFLGDGSCYLVMSDGLWPWGGGKGTYHINGNSIDIDISMDGCGFVYSYEFDPQTYTLTHISGTPILAGLAATGDKYQLEEDDANDIAKIKEMAQSFIDRFVDDEGV